MSNIQLYGWDVSPFTAKIQRYLSYKQLDARYCVPSLWQLHFKIKKDAGQIIMPVVYDNTTVLQDSSAIIDHFEARYASKSVIPPNPLHKISAYLLEILGDEWLPLAALHYRWHYPENRHFIYHEFGSSALPKFPKIAQTAIAKKMGKQMSGYLPILGITDHMQQPLETQTHDILQALNTHLSHHDFLLGSRPCIGDFSIYGPIYAHLHRDPFPNELLSPYPHVIKWINTLNGPIHLHTGQWLTQPDLPLSLFPLLQIISQVQLPLIKASIEGFNQWCQQHPDSTKLPRHFGKTTLTIDGVSSQRLNLSYVLWMWQRLQTVYLTLQGNDKTQVNHLLNQLDALSTVQTPLAKPIELKQCRLHIAHPVSV